MDDEEPFKKVAKQKPKGKCLACDGTGGMSAQDKLHFQIDDDDTCKNCAGIGFA